MMCGPARLKTRIEDVNTGMMRGPARLKTRIEDVNTGMMSGPARLKTLPNTHLCGILEAD